MATISTTTNMSSGGTNPPQPPAKTPGQESSLDEAPNILPYEVFSSVFVDDDKTTPALYVRLERTGTEGPSNCWRYHLDNDRDVVVERITRESGRFRNDEGWVPSAELDAFRHLALTHHAPPSGDEYQRFRTWVDVVLTAALRSTPRSFQPRLTDVRWSVDEMRNGWRGWAWLES
ncbi:hypothetical protein K505DRAFT_335868 [Melanomma pulvis-pyrius CBS 109.77]|uniref:Uncharacterized protein n=1 Tax=Melanomma pulvis-pyrius CBS 109.77 TaxID=1314802 RepID=A0A6A6XGR7_9PLEO|nr:hypothetical protein K505DRAFT_335868 [Melanomma pulvis-pyrius CBS 109.77]